MLQTKCQPCYKYNLAGDFGEDAVLPEKNIGPFSHDDFQFQIKQRQINPIETSLAKK